MSYRRKETYFETWAQAVTMAVLPKFSATLSLLGSGCILREVYADHKRKRSGVIKRILFGMSLTDLCMSGAWVLTTWPSPKETPIAFAVGNTGTCTAQATFLQFGNCATPIYNASLAVAYMLKVKYSLHEAQMKQIEYWFHIPPLLIATVTTIASLPLTLYNNNLYVCWIAEYPLGCNQSYNHPNPEDRNCIRGDNATIYSYAFLNIWIWGAYVVIIACMSTMYLHVRAVERKSQNYTFRRGSLTTGSTSGTAEQQAPSPPPQQATASQLRRTKAMSQQATWYIGAFFITMMPDTISIALLASMGYYNFWLHLVAYLFNPMQGYFNFIVFARSRLSMYGKVARFLRAVSFCDCFGRQGRKSKSRADKHRYDVFGQAMTAVQRRRSSLTSLTMLRRRSCGFHNSSSMFRRGSSSGPPISGENNGQPQEQNPSASSSFFNMQHLRHSLTLRRFSLQSRRRSSDIVVSNGTEATGQMGKSHKGHNSELEEPGDVVGHQPMSNKTGAAAEANATAEMKQKKKNGVQLSTAELHAIQAMHELRAEGNIDFEEEEEEDEEKKDIKDTGRERDKATKEHESHLRMSSNIGGDNRHDEPLNKEKQKKFFFSKSTCTKQQQPNINKAKSSSSKTTKKLKDSDYHRPRDASAVSTALDECDELPMDWSPDDPDDVLPLSMIEAEANTTAAVAVALGTAMAEVVEEEDPATHPTHQEDGPSSHTHQSDLHQVDEEEAAIFNDHTIGSTAASPENF